MNVTDSAGRWLLMHRPRREARVRLLCLPYAGGGASAFRHWPDALTSSIEVCPVQLPGRE
ncbi:MAG TPA: thioesterase domain-containing protein, partial [Chloroflexota bacterium]|nr:thioesterase domain-containing protein [Chloroflexota bacterium]